MRDFADYIKSCWLSQSAGQKPTTDWFREGFPDWQPRVLPAALQCPETPHISLCIATMNRLEHLKATLPANLAQVRQDPDCDLHIIDYSSVDGTATYLADTLVGLGSESGSGAPLQCYMAEGRKFFDFARARNMVALTAESGVLVIMDVDFLLGPEYLPLLRNTTAGHPSSIVTLAPWAGWMAMGAKLFRYLGGYDLDIDDGYGHQDCSLLKRAVYSGAEEVWLSVLDGTRHIEHLAFTHNLQKLCQGKQHEKYVDEQLRAGIYRCNQETPWEADLPVAMEGVFAC